MYTENEALAFIYYGRETGENQITAHWLKSPYSSIKWRIGSNTVNWSRVLPDGSNLSDPINCQLLKMIKRICFDVRSSPFSRLMNDRHHYTRINHILCILDWIVQKGDCYHARTNCFRLLDNHGLNEFITLFARGGPDEVQYISHRINILFNNEIINITNEQCIDNVPKNVYQNNNYNMNRSFSDCDNKKIRAWLYINNIYKSNGGINRKILSKLIGTDKKKYSSRVNMYLRQFEYAKDYDNNRRKSREYQSCNFIADDESAIKPLSKSQLNALKNTLHSLKNITNTVDGLPVKKVFDSINIESIANQENLSDIGHYNTTPVPIAMHALNAAIKYVIIYGEPLMEYYLEFARRLSSVPKSKRTSEIQDKILLGIKLPKALTPLKINSAISHYNKVDLLGMDAAPLVRKSASIEDAVMMLIASVYVMTATLTARRKNELIMLHSDCVNGAEGDYEINFDLGKANFDDDRMNINRPIPDLLAKALLLIKRLTESWTTIFEVNHSNNLFWVPSDLGQGTALKYYFVDTLLDRFCDFIEVPLDADGCRWYIRTHECRRFFAIVFFWQHKFSNLSALQWMLGHVDPQYTYNYIKESIGGRELTIEEARYTAAALKFDTDDKNLLQLRSLIQSHFHTTNIQIIEEDELELYLENLIEKGAFKITPHFIETEEGVSFRILVEIMEEEMICPKQ